MTKTKNGDIFEGLESQIDINRDKLSWGEGKEQFNMNSYEVKRMREHICKAKVKGTQINSLKKWAEIYHYKKMPWKLISRSQPAPTHLTGKLWI